MPPKAMKRGFLEDIKIQRMPVPKPTTDCTGKTIIVIGANVGLGKEAVRHFVRLNAKKIILGVRDLTKGEAAKDEIESSFTPPRKNIMEVWEIDLGDFPKVSAFASRVKRELDRVDAVVSNASFVISQYVEINGMESMIAVNVVGTMLLVVLLLPVMRGYAGKHGIEPVITVVSSNVHGFTELLPERDAPNILKFLNDRETAVVGAERYSVTKLLQILAVRELASRTANIKPRVILNTVNPGLAKTMLARHTSGLEAVIVFIFNWMFARNPAEGSGNLVYAAVEAGRASHGMHLELCDLKLNTLSPFVTSKEGVKAQKKLWGELVDELESIHPGSTKGLGE